MSRSVLAAAIVVHVGFASSLDLLAQQPPAAIEQPAKAEAWPPPGVVVMGEGVTAPKVLNDTKPGYTAAAMRARIQGSLDVQAVVGVDGRVGEVRVTRSLDNIYGLDEQAVSAVKEWRFEPGKKDGVAVPVLVKIELTFTLRR